MAIEPPIPALPTDNLYKFLALSGVGLMFLSIWLYANLESQFLTTDINNLNASRTFQEETNLYAEQYKDLERDITQFSNLESPQKIHSLS